MKLLKSKDYIRYNKESFKEEWGIDPIKVVDLKALMGDASDNIPGVKGIGEKTALKLLQTYSSLDGVYESIDNISGKLKEKLINDKENAYMSYDLATIYTKVPLEINLEDIKYKECDKEKLISIYEDLEFYSFLKKIKETKKETTLSYKIVDNINDVCINIDSAIYLEILGNNYHTSKILGVAIYNKENTYYIPYDVLKQNPSVLNEHIKYTYDYKKLYASLKWKGITIDSINFDTMIASYLLEYVIKDDVAYLANNLNYNIPFYDEMYKKLKSKNIYEETDIDKTALSSILKAKFIYETKDKFYKELVEKELLDLFNNIEMPLSKVLAEMELNGVYVDREVLKNMGLEITNQINLLEQDIYTLAGINFNISSPKQLGEVLFEKLNLDHGKKLKSGYSTSIEVLEKLKNDHPIIDKIIEYRTLTKLYTTYIESLGNYILEDGKIHTIYTQTLTRTGRLSSIEPNLQNIPIRYEYGKLIRKAFVPSENSIILDGDYSQIELRIMSDMANVDSLIDAFKRGIDIHTKTASDIFHVNENEVTSKMRRIAKAVNFGIIYGISSYGLSENLGITPKEAKMFIDNYFESYPGIKEYMNKTIEKAYNDGYVKTLMGRRRYIEELKNKNVFIKKSGERIALNTPIQGTSADIIKKAMIDISKEFKKRNIKSKMILQVHDELVFDCLKEEVEVVSSIVKDLMENAVKLNVPLKVDLESGNDWYQAK